MAKNYTVPEPISVKDAKIIFPNFSGKASQYNRAGDKNFCLVLSHEDGEDLADKGWNVKFKKDKETGEDLNPTLQVAVKFANYPPKIWMKSGENGTPVQLDEESVSVLDTAEIQKINLVVTGSHWGPNAEGKEGIKAYVQRMYVTIVPNDFEDEFFGRNSNDDDVSPF